MDNLGNPQIVIALNLAKKKSQKRKKKNPIPPQFRKKREKDFTLIPSPSG